MMRLVLLRPLAALGLAFMLVTGAQAQGLECRGAQKPQQVAELMFGRKIGDRVAVSQAAWQSFVNTEITPRFPDGLTVIDTRGQWRDTKRNRIIQEPSKLVIIAIAGSAEDDEKLGQIAAAYKTRFSQQSVGIIVRPACVSF